VKTRYTIKKDMPFVRAHVYAYGASEQEAAADLRALLGTLTLELPKDCTVWEPEYKGFSADDGHCYTVVVTLGEDKEGAESIIAQKVGSST
jgi:hypothetical protein